MIPWLTVDHEFELGKLWNRQNGILQAGFISPWGLRRLGGGEGDEKMAALQPLAVLVPRLLAPSPGSQFSSDFGGLMGG